MRARSEAGKGNTTMTQSTFALEAGSFFDFSRKPEVRLGVEHWEFRPLKSGPDVDPDEVELASVASIEVLVMWGRNVISVSHLTPPRDFYVGERDDAETVCDVFVPAEKTGQDRFSLVRVEHGACFVVVPPGARGFIEDARGRRALGGEQLEPVPLTEKGRVEFELGGFVFHVASVHAGRPLKKGVGVAWDWNVAAFFGLSFVTHMSLLAALAFFVPNLSGISEEESDRERLYVLQQYLDASAERERERTLTEVPSAGEQEGGSGQQAAGEQGAMGKAHAPVANKHYAVQGPKDNPEPHLAREAARHEAETFGIIAMLRGDPNAPTAPWGRDSALGTDEVSARGNMWGDEIGDAFGAGLGLNGVGEGSGGRGRGIGMGDIGSIGRGSGSGDGPGFGNGHGQLGRGHVARAPGGLRAGATTVSGRLPPEVIQRVVRQNFGRFRACYQLGLTRNPNLEGRIAARFVIARDGAVSSVANGGSDLPDSQVVSCVISAFYGLSFPQPENGIVTVNYPIMLSPG